VISANWEKCVNCLKTELPSQQFNTWIRPLQAEANQGMLRLSAPNRFIMDWVKDKFLGRIIELFKDLEVDEIEIVLQVANTRLTPTQSQSSQPVFLSETRCQQSPQQDVDLQQAMALPEESQPAKSKILEEAEPFKSQLHIHSDTPEDNPGQFSPKLNTGSGRFGAGRAVGEGNSVNGRNMDIIVAGKLSHKGSLNRTNTFENFIEGKSNQLARAASLQVAENPGYGYNPLFIYGGVGLGKTHLMHAIGNYLVQKKPDAKVVYLHSETFVGTMVTALQLNAINEFKRYYRSVDALLIDDIQFFSGKERSQEEFFHTFNALLEGGRQIILTCDRYHKEIGGLEERLKSRFGWGLSVAVDPPELETRAAILINKAALCDVELPNDSAMFIAQRLRSNVRELEGALTKVIAHARFTGNRLITPDLIKDALRDLFTLQDKLVTIDNIQRVVAEYYKIKMADMLSKKRNRSVARPRQVAMTLSKELTNHSLPEIGDHFGGRDHTTVMHACKQIAKLRHTSLDIEEDYNNLLRSLSH